jgi:hypothetical protein
MLNISNNSTVHDVDYNRRQISCFTTFAVGKVSLNCDGVLLLVVSRFKCRGNNIIVCNARQPPRRGYVRYLTHGLQNDGCQSIPSGLFPSRFPTTILRAFPISSMRDTCTAHLIILIIFEDYKLWSFSLFRFLHSRVTSSLVCPHHSVLKHSHRTFSFNVRDQASHPYKRTGTIFIYYNNKCISSPRG